MKKMDKLQRIKDLIEKYGEDATLKEVLAKEQKAQEKPTELHPVFEQIIASFKAAQGWN